MIGTLQGVDPSALKDYGIAGAVIVNTIIFIWFIAKDREANVAERRLFADELRRLSGVIDGLASNVKDLAHEVRASKEAA